MQGNIRMNGLCARSAERARPADELEGLENVYKEFGEWEKVPEYYNSTYKYV